jgi:hypothetical protein
VLETFGTYEFAILQGVEAGGIYFDGEELTAADALSATAAVVRMVRAKVRYALAPFASSIECQHHHIGAEGHNQILEGVQRGFVAFVSSRAFVM